MVAKGMGCADRLNPCYGCHPQGQTERPLEVRDSVNRGLPAVPSVHCDWLVRIPLGKLLVI